MNILTIIATVNDLVSESMKIGFSLSDITAMQQKAESKGRELSIEDFKELRDGARLTLDALSTAIDLAEEIAQPVTGHRPPGLHSLTGETSAAGGT